MSRTKLVAAAIGAAALVAIIVYAGAGAVGQAAERVGITGLILIALIHLPVTAVTGSAWSLIGTDTPGASPWKFIWARFVREATGEVLPFSQLGGIVAGVRALTLTGVGALPVTGLMLTDILIEQAAKLPYVIIGVALLLTAHRGAPTQLIAWALLPALVLAIAGIVGRRHLTSILERAARSLARRMPGFRVGATGESATLDRLLVWDRRTLAAFACHTLAWALGAAETWVMLHLMGIAVTATGALIIDSLFCGLRTFGFAVPAALGVQEAGYVLVCALLGIPAAPAVTLSLIRRVRELLIGIPGLASWQLFEGRRALAGLPEE